MEIAGLDVSTSVLAGPSQPVTMVISPSYTDGTTGSFCGYPSATHFVKVSRPRLHMMFDLKC